MNRAERRNLDRDVRKLIKADGDHCTACAAELQHNGRTYYGRVASGAAAIVGDCCRETLTVEAGGGVYVKNRYDVLDGSGSSRRAPAVVGDVDAVVAQLREAVSEVDALSTSVQARAGIAGSPGQVNLAPSLWKADDAAWFASHPDRAHRLRPLLPGERESFPAQARPSSLPPGHEIQVVVRQVQPGQRVRVPFGRNLATPVPDQEAVVHALFDSVSRRRSGSAVISVEEVAASAERYGSTTPRPS